MPTFASHQHQSPQRASSAVVLPRSALAAGRQPHPFHQLQRTIGNQAVLRLQAKLAIGPPADAFEQEADRVADHVMRTAAPQVQKYPARGRPSFLQARAPFFLWCRLLA